MNTILLTLYLAGKVGDYTDLPPVEVLLVKDLQNVSTAEAKPCLLTGNQVIMRWVVVKVTLYKGLKRSTHVTANMSVKHLS